MSTEGFDKLLGQPVQRSAKVFVRGCEKFVLALAYLFCLALVGSCLARFAYFFADLCISATLEVPILKCLKGRGEAQSKRKRGFYSSIEHRTSPL